MVYAKLDGQTQGFIVPKDSQGLQVGERQKLLGLNALPVALSLLNGRRVNPGGASLL